MFQPARVGLALRGSASRKSDCVAFVALRDGLTVGEEQLQDLVRSRVADYKTPERIAFLPVLPKGPTGKVERRALKNLALSSPEMGLAAGSRVR